jgi:peptide deformylase
MTDLRSRYPGIRVARTPQRTILPVIGGDIPARRCSVARCFTLLLLAAAVVAVWSLQLQGPPAAVAEAEPAYVTLQTPSRNTGLLLRRARVIQRSEILVRWIEEVALQTLLHDNEAAMQSYNLTCVTANMVGVPAVRLLTMETVDAQRRRTQMMHLINPVVIWGSPERSEVWESSPLYLDVEPVAVQRAHTVKVKYLTVRGGEAVVKMESTDAHCVQSAARAFHGYTVYQPPKRGAKLPIIT